MPDIPLSIESLYPILEKILVGGFLFLLFLFGILLVQKARLLNRFLHTPIAPVWTVSAWLLLISVLLVGLWYLLI